ncbi:MAG: hypothetical protein IPF54_03240 [Draconibacterium sp.]|nr:hypothetical protein [Draconibacterium sp.]
MLRKRLKLVFSFYGDLKSFYFLNEVYLTWYDMYSIAEDEQEIAAIIGGVENVFIRLDKLKKRG